MQMLRRGAVYVKFRVTENLTVLMINTVIKVSVKVNLTLFLCTYLGSCKILKFLHKNYFSYSSLLVGRRM